MFDGRLRDAVDRRTEPIGRALQRHGVTADVLTATGLVTATATAITVASGHLHLAIILLTLTGAHDLLDGPVAKAAGTASPRGAFFDSVTDRIADAVLMGGVAWYLLSAHKGHLAVLPLAILGVTALVSYERAKAETIGITIRGGIMERAERMILLGTGFLAPWLVVPVLWVLLALTALTAANRFVRVWKLTTDDVVPPSPRLSRREGRTETRWKNVDSRWRHWRAGAPQGERPSEPIGRWSTRRREALASRSGRARRARRSVRAGREVAWRGRAHR